MKSKSTKRKITETAVGAVIGGTIAGPVGAVVGGLAAGHVESGLADIARLKPPQDPRKIAADDPLFHVWPKLILVPLDFSPPSQQAVRFARGWAGFFGAEVVLLHVVEPTDVAGGFGAVPVRALQRDRVTRAMAALKKLARTEFSDAILVNVAVRKGRAFDEIATAARNLHADVIVIATHGQTGLKHVLLGGTAERVARHAPCPVLILRCQQAG